MPSAAKGSAAREALPTPAELRGGVPRSTNLNCVSATAALAESQLACVDSASVGPSRLSGSTCVPLESKPALNKKKVAYGVTNLEYLDGYWRTYWKNGSPILVSSSAGPGTA